jgi:hypothetical protein
VKQYTYIYIYDMILTDCTLQQRIVIEVAMRSRKRRAKAMKIAAVADGVS